MSDDTGASKLMNLRILCIALICTVVSGCGYEFSKPAETNTDSANAKVPENKNTSNAANNVSNSNTSENSSPSGTSTSNKNTGEKLVISAMAEFTTIPCNGREIEITEEATANNYTFTGECKKLTVGGVSNKITVEKVGEIVAKGISNKIAYGEGLNGKKPKISSSGKSTVVETIKARDERKAEASK